MTSTPIDAVPCRAARAARGRRAERAGRMAEDAVARFYEASGKRAVARRWRVREGEIYLVVRDDDTLVFVEVKSGLHAAHAITARQWARLEAAALQYIVAEEMGEMPMRFDVALVDARGAVEVIENAHIM
jgi:putative endonuclease